jgi:histidine kinase
MLSHLAVAVVGGLVTFGVVWALAPKLFDDQMGAGLGPGGGMGGQGQGYGMALRSSFATAVTNSLLIGTLSGALVAAIAGALLARRLLRPLSRVGTAVGEIARGNYTHAVPVPRETELASLVTDVNALGAELKDTEERRLHLLSEVAHEMRTPLTVIDGYVEAMIDGVLPAGTEQLGQVSSEVRRLRRLSDDLSALSRAEEGRLNLTIASVDLDALVGGVVERLRSQAEDAGVTLTAAPGAGTVQADADRTVQVFTNLIGNAIRATPSGGAITLTGSRSGGRAAVSVADSGAGLAASDLDKIFERFYRVPGTASVSDGSGIGLTVSRAYMRAQGGDLTVASAGPGQGATFTATFA